VPLASRVRVGGHAADVVSLAHLATVVGELLIVVELA